LRNPLGKRKKFGTIRYISPSGVTVFPIGTILVYLAVFLAPAMLVSLISARNAAWLNIVQALQSE